MKQSKPIYSILAGLLFIVAIGLSAIQIGYILLQDRLQMEYIDNRLFYLINILAVLCLFIAISLLLTATKRFKVIITTIVGVFIIANVILLVQSNKEIKNITSISPNLKNVFSVKMNEQAEATYYRSYYRIVSRPKERLAYSVKGDYQVEWLEDDVAVFTYESGADETQMFIGTYGSRGQWGGYYYVGPEMQGVWQDENVQVISKPEGIEVTEDGRSNFFEWEHIHQFGTLGIVLKQDGEAVWAIALNKDFEMYDDAAQSLSGSISLYKAEIGNHTPYRLTFKERYDTTQGWSD